MGPYKIVNNFLEAAGENILFGGGPGTVSPTDIEVRRNHMFRPMSWKLGEADFVGDRKSTRLNSSHSQISYAVFCLKKKNYRTCIAVTYIATARTCDASGRRSL